MNGGRCARDPLRCGHCQEVIGVYEPMIVLSDGVPVRTSRAAAKDDESLVGEHFHLRCFADRDPD